jgi:hypothetical protein
MITKQALLKSTDKPHVSKIVWVDLEKPFKKGDLVQLKGDDRWWNVVETYDEIKKDHRDINHGWHVGGL